MYIFNYNIFVSRPVVNDLGTLITLVSIPSVTLITYLFTAKCCVGEEMEHAHVQREHEIIYAHRTHENRVNKETRKVESGSI